MSDTQKVAFLLAVIETAASNVSSLMAAYPDRYPRHAFQGTLDMLRNAINVGTSGQVPT